MARRKKALPNAPFGRILSDAGAQRVSEESMQAFAEVMEEKSADVARRAKEIAEHAGRKTVKREDIRLAARTYFS